MMTSDLNTASSQAYVWVWLPQAFEPVVAGLLVRIGEQLIFNYGRSYLERPDAIALYAPELPLQAGALPLLPGLNMPSCLRDAAPDAWGRRVLLNRLSAANHAHASRAELDELSCLLESSSERIGALDFQVSASHYVARHAQSASLDELSAAADKVDRGIALSPDLGQALLHGTSLGGARPKVLLRDGQRQFIAKFSASNDLYSVVKAEFVAMRLASKVGLRVAPLQLTKSLGKDVLLVERFDRVRERTDHGDRWQRRAMVSALTLLELDEMMAAYASYEKLAELIRHRFADAKATLRELYARIVFNILCGNTDDHARNHAAFWDGKSLALTPAYDICPQARVGQQASQAMLIQGRERSSQVATCIAAAANFLLSRSEAIDIVNAQIHIIMREWQAICDEAALSEVDRALLWRRQFLNPFALQDAPEGVGVAS